MTTGGTMRSVSSDKPTLRSQPEGQVEARDGIGAERPGDERERHRDRRHDERVHEDRSPKSFSARTGAA